jgi:aldehyde:ferredoxin oxidoreductase
MDKKIYSGYLHIGSNGEEETILFLDTEPLVEEMVEIHNKMVAVSYYISDEKISLELAQECFIKSLVGEMYADYDMHYSEITGYLWTDEDLNIGGHDLLKELKTYNSKYLILIVDIHESK